MDDLRFYLKPIRKGYSWSDHGWVYDPDSKDSRDPLTRTSEELSKSLNDMVDFLKFTTECEKDFSNGFLPTLDTQTKVMDDGQILFKFYSKPMANNITIQWGTALPKNTIFASLRQELVRRMLNSSCDLNMGERLQIIEEFIQLLINSKHSFPFIKAITLQGLTKYTTMVARSLLQSDDEKFMPLYRTRSYREQERKLCKYVNVNNWFKGGYEFDKYRKDWKKKVTKRRKSVGDVNNKTPDAVMFVPQSQNSILLEKIVNSEATLLKNSKWTIKVLEQSGTPLALLFTPKFPLNDGCPRGNRCKQCKDGNGIACAARSVIYKSTCVDCRKNGIKQHYIGETSRPYRERILEHVQKRKKWARDSFQFFQLIHWMEYHGTSTFCPQFEFEVIAKYNDPLRRQLCEGLNILSTGTMNRKMEFHENLICRMEPGDGSPTNENELKKELAQRRFHRESIQDFVRVMSTLHELDNIKTLQGGDIVENCDLSLIDIKCVSNQDYTSRSNLCGSESPKPTERKRKRMETSTPKDLRRETAMIKLDDDSPINKVPEPESDHESSSEADVLMGNNKAGISSELDGIAVTPPRAESSSTENINLYIGAENLTNSAVCSGLLYSYVGGKENVRQTPLGDNAYLKAVRDNSPTENMNIARDLDLGKMDLNPRGGINNRAEAVNDINQEKTEEGCK